MRGSYAGRPEQRLIGSNDNFIVCDDVRCGHEDAESEERVVAIPLEAGGGHFRGELTLAGIKSNKSKKNA